MKKVCALFDKEIPVCTECASPLYTILSLFNKENKQYEESIIP